MYHNTMAERSIRQSSTPSSDFALTEFHLKHMLRAFSLVSPLMFNMKIKRFYSTDLKSKDI